MSSRVYIGHLSSRANEREIRDFFRGYGSIRDIVLKNGFGFVVTYCILIYKLFLVLFRNIF